MVFDQYLYLNGSDTKTTKNRTNNNRAIYEWKPVRAEEEEDDDGKKEASKRRDEWGMFIVNRKS